jgi:hypothetical protein
MKMKIIPCKHMFKKPDCYFCLEFEHEKYCYGILYYLRKLKYLPGRIIDFIKNIFDRRERPF